MPAELSFFGEEISDVGAASCTYACASSFVAFSRRLTCLVSPRRGESKSFPLKMQAHGAFSPYAILHSHGFQADGFVTALVHRVAPAPNVGRGGSWMSVEDRPISSRARATPPYRPSVGILAERL